PSSRTISDPGMLYIAIGIIGATVMPHNLYLHSSIVQTRTRGAGASVGDKRKALTFAKIDITLALTIALVVNAAILITAGATFHAHGLHDVADLQDAWQLLGPLTGTTIAGVLFALALLASGQSSTLTATLAGQIVMEGYVKLRLPAWGRRLLTRSIAVVPALCVTLTSGDAGITRLLLLSQVLLSLQLPFAIVPLIRFTSSRKIMGSFANSRWVVVAAYLIAVLIIGLDIELIRKALF
ncbi:MAG: divalent metal cation transporter, partial [Casimicrobiaceae bacterium]